MCFYDISESLLVFFTLVAIGIAIYYSYKQYYTKDDNFYLNQLLRFKNNINSEYQKMRFVNQCLYPNYKMNSPYAITEVQNFENSNGLKLPKELYNYLTQVSMDLVNWSKYEQTKTLSYFKIALNMINVLNKRFVIDNDLKSLKYLMIDGSEKEKPTTDIKVVQIMSNNKYQNIFCVLEGLYKGSVWGGNLENHKEPCKLISTSFYFYALNLYK